MPDYFTLAELRALPGMADASTYPDARVEAAAAHIVATIERELGTSFVPRTVTDEPHDGGFLYLLLDSPYVLTVTSVLEDATTVPTTGYRRKGNVLARITSTGASLGWRPGWANVLVTYTAGYAATPPADVKEMALKGTRAHLLATSSNAANHDRQTSVSTEAGVVSFVVAGADQPTGYPEVDAMLAGWRRRLGPSIA